MPWPVKDKTAFTGFSKSSSYHDRKSVKSISEFILNSIRHCVKHGME